MGGIRKNMAETKYKLPNTSKQWLLSHDFHYNRLFSDEEIEVYTYRFPVYKYEKFTVLECELSVILGNDNITINVYDYGTNNRYAPFYYAEYGNYNKMVEIIWNNINKLLAELGIIKQENKEKSINGSKNKETKKQRNYSNKRK